MKKYLRIISFVILLAFYIPAFATDIAPRTTDREIAERLTKLEEGQKNIEKRIDDLRSDMNSRFNDLRSEMNSHFDTIQWMLGLFITISLVILGFVLRMQWQMHRRLTHVETSLETQKDELAFLKGLIEKLLSTKGAM